MFLSLAAALASSESLLTHSTAKSLNTSNADCLNGIVHNLPVTVRVVVGITCVLSMIGALLIVFSYILIRDVREILVNLSLMDFMTAMANFIGVISNLNKEAASHPDNVVINNFCVAQTSFGMYGTTSSVLWTICLAVYIYLRILLESSKAVQRVVYGFYVICYGVPLILTLWFALTNKLGVDMYGGSGWCALKVYDGHGHHNHFNAIFGANIWIYLTIILVPLIFISLHFHLRYQNLSSAMQSVEIKLILIPIIFILLRVWSLLLVLLEVQFGVHLSCPALLFFLHIDGIGDSGQGFANAILFVVFTPKVSQYFNTCFQYCPSRCKQPHPVRDQRVQVQYGSLHSELDPTGGHSLGSNASSHDQNNKKLDVY